MSFGAKELAAIPAKWRRHFRVLNALRRSLLEDRSLQIAEAVEPLEPHSMDMADSATDEFDHDLALMTLGHEEVAIVEIDAAIQRILAGTYGKCTDTGRLIPEARLRALPWTRFCKAAQERLEKSGALAPAHLPPPLSMRPPAGAIGIEFGATSWSEEDLAMGAEE